jgi:osmotically-inducible protein OsmY
MSRHRSREASHSNGSTLLAAIAGVLAGAAIGVLVAHRLGGVRGIRKRFREQFGGRGFDLDALREMAGEAYEDEPLGEEFAEDELEMDEAEELAAAALESRVLAALLADPALRERAVDISALDESVVELSGWVRTRAERRRAAELARAVPGVSAVVNELFTGDPDTIPAAGAASR